MKRPWIASILGGALVLGAHAQRGASSATHLPAVDAAAMLKTAKPDLPRRVAQFKDAGSARAVAASDGHDWTRFGWDVGRSNASLDPIGITAGNIASLRRQQVRLDGTVDASPIYLAGVPVSGGDHDVFFATTTYGKTIAIDADEGSILWTYTPPDYASWAGSYQVTNATPVSDPDRAFLYAASPDGYIQKLAVEDGHAVWRAAVTLLPQREKIAASLNYFNGRVIATTGGYVGDAPPYV